MLLEREAQEWIKNKLALLCTQRAKQMLGLIQSPLSEWKGSLWFHWTLSQTHSSFTGSSGDQEQ